MQKRWKQKLSDAVSSPTLKKEVDENDWFDSARGGDDILRLVRWL